MSDSPKKRRFLEFSVGTSDMVPKTYPGPGLDNIPPEEGAALPEQDRYTGPMNDIPGGDNKNGPSALRLDVSLGESLAVGDPTSRFISTEDYRPRADPRDIR